MIVRGTGTVRLVISLMLVVVGMAVRMGVGVHSVAMAVFMGMGVSVVVGMLFSHHLLPSITDQKIN